MFAVGYMKHDDGNDDDDDDDEDDDCNLVLRKARHLHTYFTIHKGFGQGVLLFALFLVVKSDGQITS